MGPSLRPPNRMHLLLDCVVDDTICSDCVVAWDESIGDGSDSNAMRDGLVLY